MIPVSIPDDIATARHRRRVEEFRAAVDTSITAIQCPACLGPVFAPQDSDGELVDCQACSAHLVTHRDVDGVTAILVEEGGAP
jgi:hypothetical protein